MRRKKRLCGIIVGIIIILVIIFGYTYRKSIKLPLKIDGTVIVNIEDGDSFYSVLDELSNQGKLRNKYMIKFYLKLHNVNADVLQGQYELESDMSIDDIVDTLSCASTYGMIMITIPEGYTIDDIAERLAVEGVCTAEDFISAVETYPLPDYVEEDNNKRYNLEGYLFPDTYTFNPNTDPTEVIEVMVNRFDEAWNEILSQLNVKIESKDVEDIVTIASIIEKEAVVDEERSLIASVIYNRLNIDMKLQIDATVIYAHGYHIDKMMESDLTIDSPYNTYMYTGMPVGPISNPGKESIIAAINPESTDYIYYLLESENTHYFTDNYDDFLARKEELGYYMEE